MKQIESRNNPIIKKALKVLNGSNSEGLIMVEGHKLLGEALKSGAKPEMLFVTSEEALRDKTDLEDRCYIISRGLLRELSTVQTPNEILAYLMSNKNIAISRDRMLSDIWGYDFFGETRTIDVHIRTLRQKLGRLEDIIETVRGVGYRLGEK